MYSKICPAEDAVQTKAHPVQTIRDDNRKLPEPPPFIERVSEHLLTIKPPDWLIRSLIERGTVGTVFGDWNVGKSALAVNIACRVASGLPIVGQPTRQAAVLYVGNEGAQGIRRRFFAWQRHNGTNVEGSVYKTVIPTCLPDNQTEKGLLDVVRFIEGLHGSLGLAIMDTTSSTMGGDQKHGADMNAYLNALGQLFPNTTVMLLHHPGHGDKSRGRGASELPAACDWEFQLERVADFDNVIRLHNTKQRDVALHRDVYFQLLSQQLGIDDEGQPYGSVVAEHLHDYVAAEASKDPSPSQRKMLKVLRRLTNEERKLALNPDVARVLTSDWLDACVDEGIKPETARRLKGRLLKERQIKIDGIYVAAQDASQADTP